MAIGVAGFHHPLVRAAKALQQKKHRRTERCFLIEGPNAVGAALDAGAQFRHLFFTRDHAPEPVQALAERAASKEIDVYEVDARTLAALTHTSTPQGIVAVAGFLERPIAELSTISREEEPALMLVLHDLADPGNAGTLVRSAEAFGASAVCFGPNAVEPYNDKLVRASAGALFRVALFTYGSWPEFAAAARDAKVSIVAAAAGSADVRQVTCGARVAIVIGHERHGLRDINAADIERSVGIPQSAQAESLNAGVAGSIVLYEISRSTGVLGLIMRERDTEKSQAP
ncbi:MAG TPA: RNA methyltransferase [Candidatus Eremiobacteraceae bacterium]